MSTVDDRIAPSATPPRPGVVKALGIGNVVVSSLLLIGALWEAIWLVGMASIGAGAEGPGGGPGAAPTPGDLMMGMNNRSFIRFSIFDAATALIVNLVMLATGVGLLNLRRWAARLWAWTAWIKLARLALLWGYYVVAVSPSFSASMARAALVMIPKGQPGGGPSVGDLTRIYLIMNLIIAVGVIVTGSIYPAVTLWLLGRPGVKAALVTAPSKEPGLP